MEAPFTPGDRVVFRDDDSYPKDLRHWLPLPVGPCCVCGAAGARIEHRCGAFACGVPREGRPACWIQHEDTCGECRRLVALEGGPYEWAASIVTVLMLMLAWLAGGALGVWLACRTKGINWRAREETIFLLLVLVLGLAMLAVIALIITARREWHLVRRHDANAS